MEEWVTLIKSCYLLNWQTFWNIKDLGPFPYKSAHRRLMSCLCVIMTHILILQYHVMQTLNFAWTQSLPWLLCILNGHFAKEGIPDPLCAFPNWQNEDVYYKAYKPLRTKYKVIKLNVRKRTWAHYSGQRTSLSSCVTFSFRKLCNKVRQINSKKVPPRHIRE